MKRLPRKRKKQVKKIVERKRAYKIATTAMVAAQSHIQIAIIASTPVPDQPPPVNVAWRSISAAKVMVDAAQSISKIMSEPPNSWREFIR